MIYLLAVLGLCCFEWVFSSCGGQGLLFVEERGPLVVASLVARRLRRRGLGELQCTDSVVATCGL